MRLVLHDGVGRQVEDSAQGVSDAGCGRLVTSSFVPDRNDVLLKDKKTKEKVFECILIRWFRSVSVFLDLPGNVLRPQPHRSPRRPWTAPPAWPGWGSPNTGTRGLSLNEWSTFHPFYWHHPEHAKYFKAGLTLLPLNKLNGKQAIVLTSHMGLMPSLKRWKSLWPVRSPGRIMWL